MEALVKVLVLLFMSAGNETMEFVAYVRGHRYYAGIRFWVLVSLGAILFGAPILVIGAIWKNAPMLALIGGVWAALWTVVFWVFASPIGLLIEAIIAGKWWPRDVGKKYALHMALVLFWELAGALWVWALCARFHEQPLLIIPLVVALAVLTTGSIIGTKGWIDGRKLAVRLATLVAIVILLKLLLPQTSAVLQEKLQGVDAVVAESVAFGSVAAVAPVPERMRCVEAPAPQNGAYRLGNGCYVVTVPASGVTPTIFANVGGWWWDVRYPTNDIRVVLSQTEAVPIMAGACKPSIPRAGIFRIAGKPGTKVEVLHTLHQPGSC